MKFKYSAFTENTPEMREWIESLGYRNFYNKYDGDTICTVFDRSYDCRNYKIGQTLFSVYLKMIEPIDCRSNPQLFKALTSVRTDSDYMQWFTCKVRDGKGNDLPDSWVLCTQQTLVGFGWINNSPNTYGENTPYHKATVQELQEHFKLKEK